MSLKNMNKNLWATRIATLGSLGYLPAPGTLATFFTFIVALACNFWHLSVGIQCIFVCIFVVISYPIIARAKLALGSCDPSEIVLDEVVSVPLIFIGHQVSAVNVVLGFILFRIFDIVKPFGIAYCDRQQHAAFIIFDDLIAAVFANVSLFIITYFFV